MENNHRKVASGGSRNAKKGKGNRKGKGATRKKTENSTDKDQVIQATGGKKATEIIEKIQRKEAQIDGQLRSLDEKMDGYVRSGKCLRKDEKQELVDSFQVVVNGAIVAFEMRLLNGDAVKRACELGALGSDENLSTHRDVSIHRMFKLVGLL